jgi:tetratricopeptide (TPR) repeat protein
VVSPLVWPREVDSGWDPADWASFSAVALFVDRARAVRPGFALTPGNARASASICASLDGLPPAIELVAPRTAALPPQALLERLDARLILHAGELHDLSARHRTLHSAIDWSYALLSPQEQLLLARSAVFVGGWTLEAAERVAWDNGRSAVTNLEALTLLVTNSLVVCRHHGGAPQYGLLETIRAYALERLAERGEEEMVRQRHAEYYLGLAKEADAHLRSVGQGPWLDRLEAEQDNLRVSLAWFIDGRRADAARGLRLVGALSHFWRIRGHVSESRDWSARALRQGGQVGPALRAKALLCAGTSAWPGDLPLARSLMEKSLALFRESGPEQQRDLAFALVGYGLVKAYEADADGVQSACEEALALSRQVQDLWGMGMALCVLGEANLLRHDYAGACARFEESLALLRETGDKWAMGNPLLNWGYADLLLGNLGAARARLEESIMLHRAVSERTARSLTLNILAQVAKQQGDHEQAAALYAESLDLLRKMGMEAAAADVIHNLAYLVRSQGHYPLAARLYREALALFSAQGNEQGMAKCRAGLAAVIALPEGVEPGPK